MSRSRHKERKRTKGGVVAYTAGDSNVMKEAHERKRGGRVHHMEGEGEEHERKDRKRRRGGRMEHEHHRRHGGHMEHEKERRRGGRVKKASGGEIGANEKPLSTAARTSKVAGTGPENHPSD